MAWAVPQRSKTVILTGSAAKYKIDWEHVQNSWKIKTLDPNIKRLWKELPDSTLSFKQTGRSITFNDEREYYDWLCARWRARYDLFYLSTSILGLTRLRGVHQDLCDWLYSTGNQFTRMVMMTRGSFKTVVAVDAYSIQSIINFPYMKIGYFSGDMNHPKNDILPWVVGNIKQNAKLNYYFPDVFLGLGVKYPKEGSEVFSMPLPTDTQEDIEGLQTGVTFGIMSPKRGWTGGHWNVHIYDDAVTEDNYDSREIQRALSKTIDHKRNTIVTSQGINWERLFVGTCYTEFDVYMADILPRLLTPTQLRMVREPDIFAPVITDSVFYVPPFFYHYDEKLERRGNTPTYAFPEEQNESYINRKMTEMTDKSIASAQVLLKPREADDKIFKGVYALERWKTKKDLPTPLNIVIVFDWASEEQKSKLGDSQAAHAIGVDPLMRIYDLGSWEGNLTIKRFVREAIIPLFQRTHPKETDTVQIAWEEMPDLDQTMYEELASAFSEINVQVQIDIPKKHRKQSKIDFIKNMLADVILEKRFIPGPESDAILAQLDRFPIAAHDDHPDCVSVGCKSCFFRPPTAIETLKQREWKRRQEEFLQAQEERYSGRRDIWAGGLVNSESLPVKTFREN